jgi:hypothetical protein
VKPFPGFTPLSGMPRRKQERLVPSQLLGASMVKNIKLEEKLEILIKG